MNNVASVKDRLKNKSIATGKTVQELLTAYGFERTIFRLSKSQYASNFTLKGGIFLYAVFNGNYSRATTDIDLLAQRIDDGNVGALFGLLSKLDIQVFIQCHGHSFFDNTIANLISELVRNPLVCFCPGIICSRPVR